jgi:dienelactone hydrolase
LVGELESSVHSRLLPQHPLPTQTHHRSEKHALDLLTPDEEQLDLHTRQLRFDIGLLARRLIGAVDWLTARFGVELRVGVFGASTGAAAALVAAAERPNRVAAVVSRGGRPDLAGPALERVLAPTLLIVGGADTHVLALNRQATGRLAAEHRLEVVAGAGHLFEEPGALEEVARQAAAWFVTYLRQMSAGRLSPGLLKLRWRSPA